MRVPRQLLRDTATVERYGGDGALGPVYAAAETIRVSIQQSVQVTGDSRGNVPGESLAQGPMAIIRPEDGPIRPESILTARGVRYRVVECNPMPDERQPYHYELTLARWAGSSAGGSGS
jgi:hypothetical protein